MDDFIAGHRAVLDDLLLGMPGVKGGQAFGYPAYKINGRIFAFIGGRGIALKLPAERVQTLIASDEAMRAFEPSEGVVWREWLSIARDDSHAYRQDVALLEEAAGYVASLT